MSFGFKQDTAVQIDDLISTIITELKNNGGWTEIDPGYNVLRDADENFDVYFALEATNKRYIQLEIGEAGTWDTGSHSMGTPKISVGHMLYDVGASASGTDPGILRMGYDDDHCYIMTDYTGNGSNYRRCLTYIGMAFDLEGSDSVLTGLSTLPRGSIVTPVNDTTNMGNCIVMEDISGVASKPMYAISDPCPLVGFVSGSARGQISAPKQGVRYLPKFYLESSSSYPTGGENAGIRAYLQNLRAGRAYDSEAHGETIAIEGSSMEYMYFIQTSTLTYTALGERVLHRIA